MMLGTLINSPPPSDLYGNSLLLFIITVIITVFAAILGAFVSYVIYLRQRTIKEISYQVISDTPIISIGDELKGRMALLVDGREVKEAWLLVVKIWNSGNVPIKRNDLDVPITLNVEGRTVIDAEIQETQPNDLISPEYFHSFLIVEPFAIKLGSVLLNPKDSVSLKVLLTGPSHRIYVSGRIVEGRIVEKS